MFETSEHFPQEVGPGYGSHCLEKGWVYPPRDFLEADRPISGSYYLRKASYRPEEEKCIQSLSVFQLPPHSQPISAKASTTTSPAKIIPRRTSSRSV